MNLRAARDWGQTRLSKARARWWWPAFVATAMLFGTVTTSARASGSIVVLVDGPGSAEVYAELLAALPPDASIIDQSKLLGALAQEHVDDVAKAMLAANRHAALVGGVRKAATAIGADAVVLGAIRAAKGKHPAELALLVVLASQDSAAVDQALPLRKGAHHRDQFAKILGPPLEGLAGGAPAASAAPAPKVAEAAAPTKGEDAATAKPEPKPAEAAPERAETPKTAKEPTRINEALIIGFLALDLGARQMGYNQRYTQNLLAYDLPQKVLLPETPGVAAALEAYPLASAATAIARDIGVSGRFNTNFAKVQVGSGAGSAVGSTTWYAWEVNLRGRIPLGERASAPLLGLEAGGGELAFSFPPSSGEVPAYLPAVDYKYLRFGADGRIPLTPSVAVTVGAAYRVTLSAGQLEDHFPRETIGAMDARVGGAVRIANGIEARLVVTYIRNWAAFNPRPGDTYVAGGALDQFMNADLGVAAFF
jgi:hypothetical protein